MQVPVYVFTGFLESGKTTFAVDTIKDPGFSGGEKTLVIACEEGSVEYEENLLSSYNAVIEYVEDEEQLSKTLFSQFNKRHNPKQVIIEYNGMWKLDSLLMMTLPRGWMWAEIVSTVDGSTFETYMGNMRSIILEQLSQSDVIIFNRCNKSTPKASYARSIKAINRRAKFIFENEDGTIDSNVIEDLPYDINSENIVLDDEDFGIWYIDMLDNMQKYIGKTVEFTGLVYKGKELGDNCFVPGRHVMTCCEDDINFLGFLCKCDNCKNIKKGQWVRLTARIDVEYVEQYEEEGPVLYAITVEGSSKPEEDLVYL